MIERGLNVEQSAAHAAFAIVRDLVRGHGRHPALEQFGNFGRAGPSEFEDLKTALEPFLEMVHALVAGEEHGVARRELVRNIEPANLRLLRNLVGFLYDNRAVAKEVAQ